MCDDGTGPHARETNENDDEDDGDDENDNRIHLYYMRRALRVASVALDNGEVPVGCVVVLRDVAFVGGERATTNATNATTTTTTMTKTKAAAAEATAAHPSPRPSSSSSPPPSSSSHPPRPRSGHVDVDFDVDVDVAIDSTPQSASVVVVIDEDGGDDDDDDDSHCDDIGARDSVVISHGANQVNATRDATRHAELVAIDRLINGGRSSDGLMLPSRVVRGSYAHGRWGGTQSQSPSPGGGCPSIADGDGTTTATVTTDADEEEDDDDDDYWINVPNRADHWKNSYGWGSGRVY
jgi:tRNA(Arg) A34 adenosine deaminase TadA